MTSLFVRSSWGALAILLAHPALAQSVPAPEASDQQEAPPQTAPLAPATTDASRKADAAASEADPGDIVVTGSRLPSEFSGASPVQVITVNSAANAGVATTSEMLTRAVAASGTQQISNTLSSTGPGGMVVLGGANANTIGFRNLGAARTLSLLNGRRIAPSGVGSQVGPVDFNIIPSVAIDRIEVLTTGASSIYGSDAVAGVVNVLTRKGGDGLELTGFARLPTREGGKYVTASAYWGKNFDRGYVSAAVQYDQQFRLQMKDRPQTACAQVYITDVETGQRADVRNSDGSIHCYNHNPADVFFDWNWYGGSFVPNQNLSISSLPAIARNLYNTNVAQMAGLTGFARGGLGGYPDTWNYLPNSSSAYEDADSISPYRRINVYASGGYQVSDNVEAYFDLLYSNRRSETNSWSFLYPLLQPSNPNNTVAAALQYASGGRDNGLIQVQTVTPYRGVQNVSFYQGTLGFRGKFGGALEGWSFDVNTRYGVSKGSYGRNFFYNDRLNAATAAGVACNPSLITISGPVSNCPSIPWLSQRFLTEVNWTAEERAFLVGYETGHTDYDQFSIDGSVSGNLFRLPGGDVSAVFGFAFRDDNFDDQPGYNAQKGNYFQSSTAGRTVGSETVKEVFGELGVPLLAGVPGFNRLSFVASGRYTNYRSYGSDFTYKIGGMWEPIKQVMIRGSYGTSFRAPSIYELNLANLTSFFNYFDPCRRYGESTNQTVIANCRAEGLPSDFNATNPNIIGISGGGKGLLKAETSTNINAGIVIKPGILGMQLAVDFYDIKVNNEIAQFGVSNIVSSCYALSENRDTFCARITRDPITHAIVSVDNRMLNLSQQHSRGIDFALQFGFPITRDLKFGFEARGSRTLINSITRDSLSATEDRNGLTGFPKLTGTAEASFSYKNKVTLYVGGNYIGPVNDEPYHIREGDYIDGTTQWAFYGIYSGTHDYGNSNDYLTVTELTKVPAYVTLYASARFQLAKNTNVLIGVRNLLDKAPPVTGPDIYTFRTGSVPGNLYDLMGRSVFVRLFQKF